MDLATYRSYCLQKPGTTEHFPFNEETLVYKVGNKIFTLTNILTFDRISVKCDPQKAIMCRMKYTGIVPAWHMNKKHWNTILLYEGFTNEQIYEWISHSYELVAAKLPKKVKAELHKTST